MRSYTPDCPAKYLKLTNHIEVLITQSQLRLKYISTNHILVRHTAI